MQQKGGHTALLKMQVLSRYVFSPPHTGLALVGSKVVILFQKIRIPCLEFFFLHASLRLTAYPKQTKSLFILQGM